MMTDSKPYIKMTVKPSAKIGDYKIKLRASGYRLVYEVIDQEICVMVIAVGKRDKSEVYRQAQQSTIKQ